MLLMLLNLIKGPFLKYGIIALSFTGIYFYYNDLISTIEEQEKTLEDKEFIISNMESALSFQSEEIDKMKIRHTKDLDILQSKHKEDLKRTKTITIIKEKIKFIRPEEDGNISKVLKSTLENLKTLQGDNNESI